MGNQSSTNPDLLSRTIWTIAHDKALGERDAAAAAAAPAAGGGAAGLKKSASPEVISERLEARGYTMTDILALHLNRVDGNPQRYTPEFIVRLVADFEDIVRIADAESELEYSELGTKKESGTKSESAAKITTKATPTTGTDTTVISVASLGPELESVQGVSLKRAPSEGTAKLMECCLCLSPMKNPISLHCGHSACKVCLENMFKCGARQCPLCMTQISSDTKNNMHVNIVLRELILKAYPLLADEMILDAQEQELARRSDPAFNNPSHCGNWSACGGNVHGVSNCSGSGNCGLNCRSCGASTHWTCCGSTERNSTQCFGPITATQAAENDRLLRLVKRDALAIKDIPGLSGGAFSK